MRRLVLFLQSLLFLTKSESLVVLWLTIILVTGTFGSALLPEQELHSHAAPSDVALILEDVRTQHAQNEAYSLSNASPPTNAADSAGTDNTHSAPKQQGPLQKVHVNSATAEQLEQLPGIGPAMASRIITARKGRKFTSVEDLLDVKGIGKKKLEKLRPFIIVP